jgi:hypothetical protein
LQTGAAFPAARGCDFFRLRGAAGTFVYGGRSEARNVAEIPLILNGAVTMGRGILLWMLGVPIPIILLLAMCSHN